MQDNVSVSAVSLINYIIAIIPDSTNATEAALLVLYLSIVYCMLSRQEPVIRHNSLWQLC